MQSASFPHSSTVHQHVHHLPGGPRAGTEAGRRRGRATPLHGGAEHRPGAWARARCQALADRADGRHGVAEIARTAGCPAQRRAPWCLRLHSPLQGPDARLAARRAGRRRTDLLPPAGRHQCAEIPSPPPVATRLPTWRAPRSPTISRRWASPSVRPGRESPTPVDTGRNAECDERRDGLGKQIVQADRDAACNDREADGRPDDGGALETEP